LLAALQVEQVALQLQRLRLQQRRLQHALALPASATAAAAGSNNHSSSASAAGAEGALPVAVPVAVPVDATHERAHAVPEAACRAAPDPETAAWDAKLVRRYSGRFRDFCFLRARTRKSSRKAIPAEASAARRLVLRSHYRKEYG
jgi:hypothetical protein